MAAKIEMPIPKFSKAVVNTVIANFTKVQAEKSVNFFKKSFRDQGFTDKRVVKWKPRKKPKSKRGIARDKGRAILVKKGTLRRSIEPTSTNRSFGAKSTLPYAAIHNEGGKAGRNKSATIPKRQFIGESKKLFDKAEKELLKKLEKAFLKI